MAMKTGGSRILTGKTVYRALVVAGCLLALYFSTVISLANVTANKEPDWAISLWPANAAAHAKRADQVFVQDPTHAPLDQVRADALAALRRSPVLPGASRLLGVYAAAHHDEAGAQRLLHYAELMSRRDVLSQLWLIENRVQANDVRGALGHYDIVLRVAPETQQLLFPVLAGALDQADLVAPIARLVHDSDSWRSTFLYFVNERVHNLHNATTLFELLARSGTPPEQVHYAGLLARLVRENQLDDAGALYSLIDRRWRRDNANSQLDGGFDRANDVGPLGWTLNGDLAFRGARPDAAGNTALQLTIPESGAALGARRVLLLRPGAYRLTGNIGRADGTGQGVVRISLACPGAAAGTGEVAVPVPAQRAALGGTITVAACAQQWFSISIEHSGEPAAGTAWIDDLRLEPAAASPAAGRR